MTKGLKSSDVSIFAFMPSKNCNSINLKHHVICKTAIFNYVTGNWSYVGMINKNRFVRISNLSNK